MADSAVECGDGSSVSKLKKKIEILCSFLQTANSSTTCELMCDNIKSFRLFFAECNEEECDSLSNSERLHREIAKCVDFAFVPEFKNRDYGNFDEQDFQERDTITESVLFMLCDFLKRIRSSEGKSLEYRGPTFEPLKPQEENIADDDGTSPQESVNYMFNYLPKLIILIAGNAQNSLWSSKACRDLCKQLSQLICTLFSCASVPELLCSKFPWCKCNESTNKIESASLFSVLLSSVRSPLSKDRWLQNPFLVEAFCWVVSQVSSPNLSLHIDQIMAFALNLIHSHEISFKKKGIKCLHHLTNNASNEELRWYNRIDVIYDALKVQIYSKEDEFLKELLPCVFSVLLVLENPTDLCKMDKHHSVMEILLRNAEGENLILVRRVLMQQLSDFVLQCGASCVRHLQLMLRVTKSFLEVDDGEDETARIAALQFLINLITVAWMRVNSHSEEIVKSLLKFLIDVHMDDLGIVKTSCAKLDVDEKVIQCLRLLLILNPLIGSCISSLKQSKKVQCLVPVFDRILLKDDIIALF